MAEQTTYRLVGCVLMRNVLSLEPKMPAVRQCFPCRKLEHLDSHLSDRPLSRVFYFSATLNLAGAGRRKPFAARGSVAKLWGLPVTPPRQSRYCTWPAASRDQGKSLTFINVKVKSFESFA